MRKSWVAVAMIALIVGLAAGYRMGQPENPARGSVEPPGGSSQRADTGASRQEAPSVPEAPGGQPVGRTGERRHSERSTHDSEDDKLALRIGSAGEGPKDATSLRVSFPIESQQQPHGTAHDVKVSTPVAPPTTAVALTPEYANDEETPALALAPASADDPDSDRHPPVLQYLRFDPPEIHDGGVAMLSVGASDDLSGVKTVFGTVRSPSEVAIVPFNAQERAGSTAFTARIAIPRQAETGDWFVATLQVVDKAGNSLNLAIGKATVPQGGSLRVLSEESDSTAPIVRSVIIDKGAVAAGEKNQITVDVEDDRSGVALVTGTFQSPSKSAFIPFTCRPGGETSPWVGGVPIPADADCGEWSLMQLRVADKANNTAYLSSDSPQVGRVNFVVSGGGGACDSDPPVVDTLYFSPTVVSNAAPADIILTVAAHDDASGVGSLSGRVEGPVSANGQAPRIFFACAPDPNDPEAPMTAKISVPQFAAKGVWTVALVQVTDKARNSRTYNRNDPVVEQAGFTVE